MSGVFMLLFVGILLVIFQVDIIQLFTVHWKILLAGIVVYAGIGLAWTVFNWRFNFTFKVKNALASAPRSWSEMTPRQKSGHNNMFSSYATEILKDQRIISHQQSWPIKIDQHVRILAFWATYWPASMSYTIFSDFISTLYTRAIVALSGWLQTMSSKQDQSIMAEASMLEDNTYTEAK
jgi:hypothetical protein